MKKDNTKLHNLKILAVLDFLLHARVNANGNPLR
jgi:hypothetical protein